MSDDNLCQFPKEWWETEIERLTAIIELMAGANEVSIARIEELTAERDKILADYQQHVAIVAEWRLRAAELRKVACRPIKNSARSEPVWRSKCYATADTLEGCAAQIEKLEAAQDGEHSHE
jgi:hypothetical protein